jgi:hypothetical protein
MRGTNRMENQAKQTNLAAAMEAGPALTAPHGLEQIVTTFGDIYDYIRPGGDLDPRWQADYLAAMELPFPMRLSWDRAKSVSRMTCHKRMVEVFAAVFQLVQRNGLESKISSFGGCFAFRQQRTGAKLSTHSWGIAIDLNPGGNSQGSPGNMDAGLIDVFRGAGFEWGGGWQGTVQDPMHFQFCSGF